MSALPIKPISFFEGPSKTTYTLKIKPISREKEYQKRKLRERKQKGIKIGVKMNEMAKGFADIMFSYDMNGEPIKPNYYSFEKSI